MDFTKGSYADGFTEVDVACYGGGADVEPVWVIRGEFFEGCGFDDVDPRGDFQFACEGKLNWRRKRNGTYLIVLGIERML